MNCAIKVGFKGALITGQSTKQQQPKTSEEREKRIEGQETRMNGSEKGKNEREGRENWQVQVNDTEAINHLTTIK
jgi:hypothetical protein